MKAVTGKEMAKIDRRAFAGGIKSLHLMENAGRGVASQAIKFLCGVYGKKIAIVCGSGNNGGDGFVAARILNERGAKVSVFTLAPENKIKGDALFNYQLIQDTTIEKYFLVPGNINFFRAHLENSHLLIDAIFGTGFRGSPQGLYKKIIDIINESTVPVISIDIPSGVNADSGEVAGAAILAEQTATLALPKIGLLVYPGAKFAGEINLVDIGIPEKFHQTKTNTELLEASDILTLLPSREPDAHKNSCGRVFVLAGSTGLTGAATMAALSILKAGAGVSILGIPSTLNKIFETKLTEVMTTPLPDDGDGYLSEEGYDQIIEFIKNFDVVIIGPGIGQKETTQKLTRRLIPEIDKPLVIDADGLNAVSNSPNILRKRKNSTVITPHPGELSRLLKISSRQIQSLRIDSALLSARKFKAATVLKGARTIIATPQGEIAINPTGNAGMATAGSGDVLTGMIGAFLAQGLDCFEASQVGVYLHGLAGDLASSDKGESSILAGDLIDYIEEAIDFVEETPYFEEKIIL